MQVQHSSCLLCRHRLQAACKSSDNTNRGLGESRDPFFVSFCPRLVAWDDQGLASDHTIANACYELGLEACLINRDTARMMISVIRTNEPTQSTAGPRRARRFKNALSAGVAVTIASLLVPAPAHAWEMRVCADFNRMPLSHDTRRGYEVAIAEVIADELGAELTIEYWPARDVLINNALRPGDCDVVMGAGGDGTLLETFAYYRSPFVFIYRADEDYDIFTFDDPILRDLRIGVQPVYGPTHQSLLRRRIDTEHITGFDFVGGADDPLAPAIEAVANNEIDVALMWGPAAGYYAALQDVELIVQPVPPFEPPFIPMYVNVSIGVRLGDEALRDAIDIALANRWDDIYAILAEFNVPTMQLARPTLTIDVP